MVEPQVPKRRRLAERRRLKEQVSRQLEDLLVSRELLRLGLLDRTQIVTLVHACAHSGDSLVQSLQVSGLVDPEAIAATLNSLGLRPLVESGPDPLGDQGTNL
jgi:hypothetical protein